MGSGSKKARGLAGYTLVELMMIVTIIGISVTAFAPGFGRAMADRRVSTASRELVRMGRRARSDTFGYLRAHLLWIQPATGQVQLLRGTTNSCLLTTWKSEATDCDKRSAGKGQRCLESLTVGSQAPIALREEALGGSDYDSSALALCYAPSGIVYWARKAELTDVHTKLVETNTVQGGFVYALYPGTAEKPAAGARVQRVLFPLGGTPRGLR